MSAPQRSSFLQFTEQSLRLNWIAIPPRTKTKCAEEAVGRISPMEGGTRIIPWWSFGLRMTRSCSDRVLTEQEVHPVCRLSARFPFTLQRRVCRWVKWDRFAKNRHSRVPAVCVAPLLISNFEQR